LQKKGAYNTITIYVFKGFEIFREVEAVKDRVGFIGVGAMGGALLKGLLESGVRPGQIVVYDAVEERLREVAERFGVEAGSGLEIAEACRVIFLAVKPQDMGKVLEELKDVVTEEHVIVSVAAGIGIGKIEEGLGGRVGVIRVMPNTPCLVGEGAMAVSCGKVADSDLQMVLGWLEGLGVVRVVPEKLLDAVTGLSGSGPAYVYLLIEALSDGGCTGGLPRDLAGVLAVQTVLGAAEMVRETGEHAAVLREKVTSPGGTTAAGLFELEVGGVRAAVIKAVRAATERSKELGNQ
jgi:pyrroline-5-carboxylate reductase